MLKIIILLIKFTRILMYCYLYTIYCNWGQFTLFYNPLCAVKYMSKSVSFLKKVTQIIIFQYKWMYVETANESIEFNDTNYKYTFQPDNDRTICIINQWHSCIVKWDCIINSFLLLTVNAIICRIYRCNHTTWCDLYY